MLGCNNFTNTFYTLSHVLQFLNRRDDSIKGTTPGDDGRHGFHHLFQDMKDVMESTSQRIQQLSNFIEKN